MITELAIPQDLFSLTRRLDAPPDLPAAALHPGLPHPAPGRTALPAFLRVERGGRPCGRTSTSSLRHCSIRAGRPHLRRRPPEPVCSAWASSDR